MHSIAFSATISRPNSPGPGQLLQREPFSPSRQRRCGIGRSSAGARHARLESEGALHPGRVGCAAVGNMLLLLQRIPARRGRTTRLRPAACCRGQRQASPHRPWSCVRTGRSRGRGECPARSSNCRDASWNNEEPSPPNWGGLVRFPVQDSAAAASLAAVQFDCRTNRIAVMPTDAIIVDSLRSSSHSSAVAGCRSPTVTAALGDSWCSESRVDQLATSNASTCSESRSHGDQASPQGPPSFCESIRTHRQGRFGGNGSGLSRPRR